MLNALYGVVLGAVLTSLLWLWRRSGERRDTARAEIREAARAMLVQVNVYRDKLAGGGRRSVQVWFHQNAVPLWQELRILLNHRQEAAIADLVATALSDRAVKDHDEAEANAKQLAMQLKRLGRI